MYALGSPPLSSDSIGLIDKLRVYLDQGHNFDVDVTRLEGVTDAECREGLDVIVRLPQTDRGVELTGNTTELVLRDLDCPHVEFGGRVSIVVIDGLVGHVELDANGDVDVSCASLPAKLESAITTVLPLTTCRSYFPLGTILAKRLARTRMTSSA